MEQQALAFAMSTHPRLGIDSPGSLPPELLLKIMDQVQILVPQQCSLYQALQVRTGRKPGAAPIRIHLAKGEHSVGTVTVTSPLGLKFGTGAENIISVHNQNVIITGDAGAKLRGMIVAMAGSQGIIRGIELVDAGDCCFQALGGKWELEDCKIRCGHASAIRAENDAHVTLKRCVVGGEGQIVTYAISLSSYRAIQEHGLTRHACFGLFAKGSACICSEACELQYCSESAVLICENASLHIRDTKIKHSKFAFTSGVDRGRNLVLERTHLGCIKYLWYDDDRPTCFESDCHTFMTETCGDCPTPHTPQSIAFFA
eukprot:c10161_g1_i1.p1 GENE.c10161_g1_i1~~c10161_g1_i1.p1  ORF type:complete len:338 (-),score=42.44 c10161_g1_i1:640-1584(-)